MKEMTCVFKQSYEPVVGMNDGRLRDQKRFGYRNEVTREMHKCLL